MTGRIRVFCASSLDGFIAGEGDDLSWLPDVPEGGSDHGYGAFMATVGALLMGRGTYDVVEAFGQWPYGEKPVLVATRRPLAPPAPSVRAVEGPIEALVAQAREAAAGADVYLDGGVLIRQALEAGLIDEAIVTLIPVVLGKGHPLFAGVAGRHPLTIAAHESLPGGLVQLTLRAPLTVARLVLAVSGLIFLAFGLAFLADPLRFLGTLGPLTASPDLVTDLRAIYGGLNTGLGVWLLASVRVPALHRPGLALIAATLGVVAVGRAAGMLTSGFDRSVTPVFLGLEALGAVLAAVAWWRLGRAAR